MQIASLLSACSLQVNRSSRWRVATWLLLTAVVGMQIAPLAFGQASKLAATSDDAAGPSAAPAPSGGTTPAVAPTPANDSIDIFKLTIDGGIFMIPIFGLSLVAVTMIIERFIGLRQQKVLPDELVEALGQLGSSDKGFDPRKAYRLCQQYPSNAANVIRAMLLKVGRPLPEIEQTIAQASARESDRMYANIRWLNLSASVAPLLGLLGTVQGMILAFHMTTTLDPTQNKSLALATGIYTALVTTFAGLCVAIPAAIFSHYFEGRILSLFHSIDELIFNLIPQLERYEGRVRFSRQGGEEDPLATTEKVPEKSGDKPLATAGAGVAK